MFIECPECKKKFKYNCFDGVSMKFCPECGSSLAGKTVEHSDGDKNIYSAEKNVENVVPVLQFPNRDMMQSSEHLSAQGRMAPPAPEQLMQMQMYKLCPMCGEVIMSVAKKCRFCNSMLDEKCSHRQEKEQISYPLYVLLCFFFGYIGVHNLYAKQYGSFAFNLICTFLAIFSGVMAESCKIEAFVVVFVILLGAETIFHAVEMCIDPNRNKA